MKRSNLLASMALMFGNLGMPPRSKPNSAGPISQDNNGFKRNRRAELKRYARRANK